MKSSTLTQFQITRPTYLEFVLCYGGVTSREMLSRIKNAGRKLGASIEAVASDLPHELTEKGVRIAAFRLADWFAEQPTTKEIYAMAKTRGLKNPHPTVGLHIAEIYTEQPFGESIWIGSNLLRSPGDGSRLIQVSNDELGCHVDGSRTDCTPTWDLLEFFAFEIPED